MYNLYKNIINGAWERPVFYLYKKKNLLKSTGYLGGDTGIPSHGAGAPAVGHP